MGEILQIARRQLWMLTVWWPAWLLTPHGRKILFSRKTLRRAIMSVALSLIIVGLAQTLPFDLALILAGDVLAYAEVAAIAWIATANGVLTQAGKAVAHAGVSALRRVTSLPERGVRPAAGRPRRPRRPAAAPANDDDGPARLGWALAA